MLYTHTYIVSSFWLFRYLVGIPNGLIAFGEIYLSMGLRHWIWGSQNQNIENVRCREYE